MVLIIFIRPKCKLINVFRYLHMLLITFLMDYTHLKIGEELRLMWQWGFCMNVHGKDFERWGNKSQIYRFRCCWEEPTLSDTRHTQTTLFTGIMIGTVLIQTLHLFFVSTIIKIQLWIKYDSRFCDLAVKNGMDIFRVVSITITGYMVKSLKWVDWGVYIYNIYVPYLCIVFF